MSGKGSRFLAAGYKELKPFIPVAGKPIISHILDMYPSRERTIFIVNETDPQLKAHTEILRNLSPNATIVQIPDNRLGPSFAVLAAQNNIDEKMPVVVNYADFAGNFSEEEFTNSLNDYDANILTYSGFHPHMLRNFKYAYVKKQGSIVTHIQEKQPYTNSPMEEEASAGAYAFKSGDLLIKAIEDQISKKLDLNGEFYTSLTMQPIIDWGYKIGTTLMEKFYQWGTPEDLEDWKSWNTFIKSLNDAGLSVAGEIEHDAIILAGGKGSRLAQIATTPKALFPVRQKQLWEYSIISGRNVRNQLLIRPEYVSQVSTSTTTEISTLEVETKGQADTASIALNSRFEKKGGISFLSCDNVILKTDLPFKDADGEKLYVWTTRNYLNAKLQPNQFSWVEVSEEGKVSNFMPKQNPTGKDVRTVIGNFTFSSKEFAHKCIQYCTDSKNHINGEAYLDSAIRFALENNFEIATIDVENFKAIGTEIELQTFNYWNECWERHLPTWK